MMVWVLLSQITNLPSAPALARKAPFGDQAISFI